MDEGGCVVDELLRLNDLCCEKGNECVMMDVDVVREDIRKVDIISNSVFIDVLEEDSKVESNG